MPLWQPVPLPHVRPVPARCSRTPSKTITGRVGSDAFSIFYGVIYAKVAEGPEDPPAEKERIRGGLVTTSPAEQLRLMGLTGAATSLGGVSGPRDHSVRARLPVYKDEHGTVRRECSQPGSAENSEWASLSCSRGRQGELDVTWL